jgi:hypothetical protein
MPVMSRLSSAGYAGEVVALKSAGCPVLVMPVKLSAKWVI